MKTLSYHNSPKIKEELIKRMNHHIEMDELLQGAIGSDNKGCTVWCALNNGELKRGYDHAAFEDVLGLPEWLARLQDTIFEGLPAQEAKEFSGAWPKVIPVGKNLEPVKWRFCAFILKRNIERVLTLDIPEDLKKQVVEAIEQCLNVHSSAIETGVWDESAAWSARSAAESAAWSAARSAAWSAARSAAESAAWSAEYKIYAAELLKLLSEA